MKVAAIIQARMTSTRLPGKVLKEVLDKPLLEYQIERVRKSKLINEVIIATTTNSTENPIIEFCDRLNINYYRGSEENVLERYYNAALKYNADIIVRLTSDCPVIDPFEIDKAINYYLENQNSFDYVSNTLIRTYPRGMDTEVFPFTILEKTYNEAKQQHEKEHVTPYIYSNPDKFRLGFVSYHKDISKYRWTVDTEEDFTLISKIIEALYLRDSDFSMDDIVSIIENNPDWQQINSHIEQKKLGE